MIDQQLAEQNAIAGWRPCEGTSRGRHDLRLSEAQFVAGEFVDDPVYAYIPCARCPVSIRARVLA